jgi:hypothetical protein
MAWIDTLKIYKAQANSDEQFLIVREGAGSGVCWAVAGSKVKGMFIDGIERRPYILITSVIFRRRCHE